MRNIQNIQNIFKILEGEISRNNSESKHESFQNWASNCYLQRTFYSFINSTGNRTFLSELKQLYEKVHIDKFPRETNPHGPIITITYKMLLKHCSHWPKTRTKIQKETIPPRKLSQWLTIREIPKMTYCYAEKCFATFRHLEHVNRHLLPKNYHENSTMQHSDQ